MNRKHHPAPETVVMTAGALALLVSFGNDEAGFFQVFLLVPGRYRGLH